MTSLYVIDCAKKALQGQTLSSAIDVVKVLMEYAEKHGDLAGEEKSRLVKALIMEPVIQELLPANVKSAVDLLVSNDLVQPTIDLAIGASRGQLNVNKVAVQCCLPLVSALVERFKKRSGDAYKE